MKGHPARVVSLDLDTGEILDGEARDNRRSPKQRALWFVRRRGPSLNLCDARGRELRPAFVLSVLDVLARNLDDEGAVTMSRSELASQARCGVRTVAAVLSVCRARRYLSRDPLRRQPGSATRWQPATWRFASWIYDGQAFGPLLQPSNGAPGAQYVRTAYAASQGATRPPNPPAVNSTSEAHQAVASDAPLTVSRRRRLDVGKQSNDHRDNGATAGAGAGLSERSERRAADPSSDAACDETYTLMSRDVRNAFSEACRQYRIPGLLGLAVRRTMEKHGAARIWRGAAEQMRFYEENLSDPAARQRAARLAADAERRARDTEREARRADAAA